MSPKLRTGPWMRGQLPGLWAQHGPHRASPTGVGSSLELGGCPPGGWGPVQQLTGVVGEEAALPGLMLQLLSSAMARPQPWHPKPQLPAVSQAGACRAGPRSSVGKGEVGKRGRAAPSWTASPAPLGESKPTPLPSIGSEFPGSQRDERLKVLSEHKSPHLSN